MAMLREFCTVPEHVVHQAVTTENGRLLCPVCSGERASRTAPIVDWSSPHDPTVKLGLTFKCGACKAPPGTPCTNTVNGRPLSEIRRVIHHFRLDKAFVSALTEGEAGR